MTEARERAAADERPADPVEELLAQCLERVESGEADALAGLCAAHPEHADALRRRVARLERLGLHGSAGPDFPASSAALPSSDTVGAPPSTFGRYRILEKLGEGGMGVVWLALDERLGRKVALKVGSSAWASDRARARFEREVRAAAQLDHPRIVPIFDVGERDGTPWFTMQFVEGATLADVLATLREQGVAFDELSPDHLRRALAQRAGDPHRAADAARAGEAFGDNWIECVCRIAIDVADALEHAHAHGVVHRDVKPSNVLVGLDGRAQLFDLGLAHLADEPALTRTGDFAGTPQYVAPEQIGGRPEDIDARSDVYALGVTLYELLCLRPPFTGPGTQAVLRQILTREPPLLRRINALVPRDLETICLTALEKDPARRYASARELGLDLRRFLAFQPVHARPAGAVHRATRWLRRNRALGAALFLAALLLVGAPLGLLWSNALVSEQRDRAEDAARDARFETARAEQVADFLVELFRGGGEATTARELLERGAERIDPALSEQPLVQAALMESVGRVWTNLGEGERALPLFDQALAIRQRELGEGDLETARLLLALAQVHAGLGDERAAEALGSRAERAFELAGEARHPLAAQCQTTLGEVAARRGALDEARARHERALFLLRELAGEERALADALERLGRVELAIALERGRGASEGKPVAAAALDGGAGGARTGLDAVAGAEGPALAPDSARSTGAASAATPRACPATAAAEPAALAEAEAHLVESLALRRAAWDPAPAEIAASWSGLGAVARARGDLSGARDALAQALAIERAVLGEGADATTERRLELACAALALADCARAAETLTPVLEPSPVVVPDDRSLLPRAAELALSAASCFAARGEPERASELERLAAELSARGEKGGLPGDGALQPTPYLAAFQEGITALQSGRHEDAIAAFERCLAIDGRRPVVAYNLACAHALAGSADRALAWLDRAIDQGFALRPNSLTTTRKDSDLRALHRDPRFARALERMAEVAAVAEAYSARPALHVPERVRPDAEWPLLVVLHADGSTKDQIVAGPWRALAEELGCALLAPSGRFPVAGEPARGMSWFDEDDAYVRRPWQYERPVIEALRSARAEHRIARDRIVIAGERSGARVALRVALRAPGLYRGVLLEVASPDDLPELDERAGRDAAALGLAVLVRCVGDAGLPTEIAERVASWGIGARIEAGIGRVEAVEALLER